MSSCCAYCNAKKAKARCGLCGIPYCDRRCQKQGWRMHKALCSDDREAVVVEHAVERAVEVALTEERKAPETRRASRVWSPAEKIY